MSEEARFSYTVKDDDGSLVTARGDTLEEFLENAAAVRAVVFNGWEQQGPLVDDTKVGAPPSKAAELLKQRAEAKAEAVRERVGSGDIASAPLASEGMLKLLAGKLGKPVEEFAGIDLNEAKRLLKGDK